MIPPHVHSFVVLFRIWEWVRAVDQYIAPAYFDLHTYFWYFVHYLLFLSFNSLSIYWFKEYVCVYLCVCICTCAQMYMCVVYMCTCPPVWMLVCMVFAHVKAEIVGCHLLYSFSFKICCLFSRQGFSKDLENGNWVRLTGQLATRSLPFQLPYHWDYRCTHECWIFRPGFSCLLSTHFVH